jgi:hypothetical protein
MGKDIDGYGRQVERGQHPGPIFRYQMFDFIQLRVSLALGKVLKASNSTNYQ